MVLHDVFDVNYTPRPLSYTRSKSRRPVSPHVIGLDWPRLQYRSGLGQSRKTKPDVGPPNAYKIAAQNPCSNNLTEYPHAAKCTWATRRAGGNKEMEPPDGGLATLTAVP